MSDAIPIPKPPTQAELIQRDLRNRRITTDRDRLRTVILSLRKQVKNPAMLDAFLSNLNPVTAIDGRLPFTPHRVVTVANKTMLLHNALSKAVVSWGHLARGEDEEGNPEHLNPNLVLLEQVAASGFQKWGAYPKDRNSTIHVLRTAVEEAKIRKDRAVAQERALEAKARVRDGGSTAAEEPKTGLEQEEPDESDATQVVAGGSGEVAGQAPGPGSALDAESGEEPEAPPA